MELGKTACMLILILSSSKVLCATDTTESYTTKNEEATSIRNNEESTTVSVPVAKNQQSLPITTPQPNINVIKNNTNEAENSVTEKNSSDDVLPNELENLIPTNSSNFAYRLDSNDPKSKNNNKDTEAVDMLNVHAPSVDYDLAPDHPSIVYKPDDPVDTHIFLKDDSINVNYEGMKSSEDNTIYKTKNLDHFEVLPGMLAAILAGVFLTISIAGYISLLTWRRYLENRYGNREMLVEDDYCEKNMNDLEHFSI